MILLGSKAALLQGHLPSWRAAKSDDTDIVGTEDEYQTLLARLNNPAVTTQGNTEGRRYVVYAKLEDELKLRTERLEFTLNSSSTHSKFYDLPDNKPVTLLGLRMLAISPVTQLVLKRAIVEALPFRKTQLDLLFYCDFVGTNPPLSAAHVALENTMRAESQRLASEFNLTPLVRSKNNAFDTKQGSALQTYSLDSRVAAKLQSSY